MKLAFALLGTCAVLGSGCSFLGNDGDGDDDRPRLEFRLSGGPSDDALAESVIIAGHEQRFFVELTARGLGDIDDPADITYELSMLSGVTLTPLDGGTGDPPDFNLLVTKPSSLRLEAYYRGSPLQGIDLMFENPAGLGVDVRVRQPSEGSLSPVPSDEVTPLIEGAEVDVSARAVDSLGDELEGTFGASEVRVSPETAISPHGTHADEYADGVWTVGGNFGFVAIEPGELTVEFTEPVTGAVGTHVFDVSAP